MAYLERVQPVGVSSFFPYGFWILNSDPLAWWQVPFPIEPFSWPLSHLPDCFWMWLHFFTALTVTYGSLSFSALLWTFVICLFSHSHPRDCDMIPLGFVRGWNCLSSPLPTVDAFNTLYILSSCAALSLPAYSGPVFGPLSGSYSVFLFCKSQRLT